MALFYSKQDVEKVHLLTQMAQIDIENENELCEFAKRWARYDKPETAERMAVMCDIVRRALLGLATQSAVPADCIAWVNDNALRKMERLEINAERPGYVDGEDASSHGKELLPLADLKWNPYYFFAQNPMAYMVQKQIAVIFTACMYLDREGKPTLVKICKECKNPLVMNYPSQVYCSARCGNRARTRERRAAAAHSETVSVAGF